MPSPRAELRTRRGWTHGHFSQLNCGWDYTGDGWGMLSQLSDEALSEAIEGMLVCYRHHYEDVLACALGSHRSEPWFAQYVRDPHALFVCNHKARSYMEYQRDHGGYRPYDEFEQQYQPPGVEAVNA